MQGRLRGNENNTLNFVHTYIQYIKNCYIENIHGEYRENIKVAMQKPVAALHKGKQGHHLWPHAFQQEPDKTKLNILPPYYTGVIFNYYLIIKFNFIKYYF